MKRVAYTGIGSSRMTRVGTVCAVTDPPGYCSAWNYYSEGILQDLSDVTDGRVLNGPLDWSMGEKSVRTTQGWPALLSGKR